MKDQNSHINPILTVALIIAVAALSGCASKKWEIENPYAAVDWTKYQQYKAHFHTHTTESDGRVKPAAVIEEYRRLGYGVLALTDHNKVTWPWEDQGRVSSNLGMVAVEAAEASKHNNLGTFFCNVPGRISEKETLADVRQQGGIAVVFHPGRYKRSAQDYIDLYKQWDVLVGMEVYNAGDRYPGDRQTWDQVLTALMPARRPVWGFSNDDMHRPELLGRNWNILVLPELSSASVRRAMENGVFFFVHAPQGHKGHAPPEVKALTVDSRKGVIRIHATDHSRIEWISGGTIVQQGDTMDLSMHEDVRGYVRAVIYAEDGVSLIGTQPFRIQNAKQDRIKGE
jgi:hypothetical protein